jgi:hypothetical protein
MKKILFVQLPPPRFDFEEPGANIPLAAGFLVSALKVRECLEFETEILNSEISDVFGDSGLTREIVERSPDILAMTLYLWNSQRSLFIAAAVKRLLPEMKVIVGGPEVTHDNEWILRHPAVDSAIIGEGEPQFAEALRELSGRPQRGSSFKTVSKTGSVIFKKKQTTASCWELGSTTYPYFDGIIGPSQNGSLFLETARGCPFKCRYCYYHKAFDSVSLYPFSTIEQALDFAYSPESNVNEIYLMDPTFNARMGFRDILKSISVRRRKKDIRIHTELRADLLKDGDIALLKDAGLVSAEIGLQSVNLKVLELAGRYGDPEKVLEKAGELTEAGVDVTTGIILGLPGDTPVGFSNTLRRLKETHAFSVIQPFTLAVLPGSDFRRDASDLGFQYDIRPPYYLKASETFSAESMKGCLDEFEETFEMELDYIGLPSLVDDGSNVNHLINGPGYISKWIVNLPIPDIATVLSSVIKRASNPFTIWFKGADPSIGEQQIIEIISVFETHNPHTVLHLVFEFGRPVPTKLFRSIIDATANPEIYINKAFFPLYPEGEILSPNFIVITPLPDTDYARNVIVDRYFPEATVVWSANLSITEHVGSAVSPILISGEIPSDSSARCRLFDDLKRIAGSRPEEILFRDEEAQRLWNRQVRGLSESSRFEEKLLVSRPPN